MNDDLWYSARDVEVHGERTDGLLPSRRYVGLLVDGARDLLGVYDRLRRSERVVAALPRKRKGA